MRSRNPPRLALAMGALSLLTAPGCRDGEDDDGGAEPLFPEDYASSYAEVRACRPSGDHDLANIRVFADAAAEQPFLDRMEPFPEGAVVLKAEYDFGDAACADEVEQWTVMQRLATGSSPDTLDWSWQQVDFERHVVGEDASKCISCHTSCSGMPWHEGTCTQP